jgi:hypothetical protein
MLRLEPRFVSADDFENYWGENLNAKLKGDNYSNKADKFLLRIENRLMTWLDANTFRVYEWDHLSDFQLENLQLAILEQAMYVFRNSDLALDSGYDPEQGVIADYEKINSIAICQPAIDLLKTAGLFNLRITNKRRFTTFN